MVASHNEAGAEQGKANLSLHESILPSGEIVGRFESQSGFSFAKAFKKQIGFTAGEARKQSKSESF